MEALAPYLGGDISALARTVDLTPSMPHMDLTNNVAGGAVTERAAELSPGRFQRIAAKILGIRTEATSWEVGAAGERRVGNRLDRLKSRGWNVLHSVPLKSGADIDHIVIGPGGVITVSATAGMRRRLRLSACHQRVVCPYNSLVLLRSLGFIPWT